MIARTNILVFEPEANGHQMDYLRYLLTSIEANVAGAHVTLLTVRAAMEHPNCRSLIDDFAHMLDVRIAPPVHGTNRFFRMFGQFYEQQWKYAEIFAIGLSEIGAENVDFILLPYLETMGLLQLGLRPNLFMGKPWATIAVGLRFHHRRAGIPGPSRWEDILQSVFFNRVAGYKGLACLGSVNPYLAATTLHPKAAFCPEPCAAPQLTGVAEARRAYGIRPESCVVIVFGNIDRRKCLDVLLAGAAQVDPKLDLTIFLAGPQNTAYVRGVMNGEAAAKLRAQGRLVEVNRFLASGRDIEPMSAADIAWVFYEPQFVYNSSVLVRSGLSGRPVICRHTGVIGRLVEEHRCGLALPSDAPGEVAAALTKLARDPALRQEMGENGRRAFAGNTPEVFARPIVEAIGRAMAAR